MALKLLGIQNAYSANGSVCELVIEFNQITDDSTGWEMIVTRRQQRVLLLLLLYTHYKVYIQSEFYIHIQYASSNLYNKEIVERCSS